MKPLIATATIILTIVFATHTAFAADMEIECGTAAFVNKCEIVKGPTLFNETNWTPGSTAIRTIHMVNEDRNDSCDLKLYLKQNIESDRAEQITKDLSEHIFTAISTKTKPLFGSILNEEATKDKSLQDLMQTPFISLGNISKNGEAHYWWYATFDHNGQNELQGSQTKFDFSIEFKCEDNSEDATGETPTSRGGTGNVAGIQIQNLLNTVFNAPVAVVAAANSVAENPVLLKEQPQVAGISSESCKEPWYLWLIIPLQFVIQILIRNRVNKDRPGTFYLWNIGAMLIAGVILYKLSCSWILNIISLVVGILALSFRKRS